MPRDSRIVMKPGPEYYRRVRDLPPHLYASGWRWRRARGRHHWIGTDRSGRSWFVKMTGSECAHRERVFDLLAQNLGLSCQSCVYLTLPEEALPLVETQVKEFYHRVERHQGAIAYI